MSETKFTYKPNGQIIKKGSISVQSPSNIALVKYWGKKPIQIPTNTSISFTLNNCHTITKLNFEKASKFEIDLFVDNKKNTQFLPKIEQFFERVKDYIPYIFDYRLKIETRNTFPHSSGIASSASGFSALAYAIVQLEQKIAELTTQQVMDKASFLSRLGSGSACRSIYGPLAIWGNHQDIKNSSDLYGTAYNNVNDVFKSYQDTILLIDKGQKKVSSTVGHGLMKNHPFAEQRFLQAQNNIRILLQALKDGDINSFIQITESEALTLHAMMMTSNPYFILMREGTLAAINKIWEYRNNANIPISFTLDAGANVHLLYPKLYSQQVLDFIKKELIVYCENEQYICDHIGQGTKLIDANYD